MDFFSFLTSVFFVHVNALRLRPSGLGSDLKILRILFQSYRYEEMHAGVYAFCCRLNDLGIAATDTWRICRMNSSLKQ